MSRSGDDARLVKIMTYIGGIEMIIARHGGARHEYNGILWDIAEKTLIKSIPDMKDKIIGYLKNFPEFPEWEKLWQR